MFCFDIIITSMKLIYARIYFADDFWQTNEHALPNHQHNAFLNILVPVN